MQFDTDLCKLIYFVLVCLFVLYDLPTWKLYNINFFFSLFIGLQTIYI